MHSWYFLSTIFARTFEITIEANIVAVDEVFEAIEADAMQALVKISKFLEVIDTDWILAGWIYAVNLLL